MNELAAPCERERPRPWQVEEPEDVERCIHVDGLAHVVRPCVEEATGTLLEVDREGDLQDRAEAQLELTAVVDACSRAHPVADGLPAPGAGPMARRPVCPRRRVRGVGSRGSGDSPARSSGRVRRGIVR